MLDLKCVVSCTTDINQANKRPYIKYTIIALLSLNVAFMIYLSCKLWTLLRLPANTHFEKRNRRYRVLIYVLIFLGLLLRAVFEGDQLYQAIFQEQTKHLEPFALIIDALPSLILMSIACAFSYFWHALYSSFEVADSFQARRTRFGFLLIALNIILYTVFIACSVLHFSLESRALAIIMRSLCVFGIIFGTVMLNIHGNRLYERALHLVNYTGRNVKSTSGFKRTYNLLLICSVIKCIKEGITLCFSIFVGPQFLDVLENLEEGVYLPLFIAYVLGFYVVGEYGMFLSLIKLLDSSANRSKRSFAEEALRTMHESQLLDDESDNYFE